MFPNIDNKLNLRAVRKALEQRNNLIPSTDCTIEAVEICLQSYNNQFGNNHFVQTHGIAMGQKNACSYDDLAMGEIDAQARFNGPHRPNYWLRYRDDVFDI